MVLHIRLPASMVECANTVLIVGIREPLPLYFKQFYLFYIKYSWTYYDHKTILIWNLKQFIEH